MNPEKPSERFTAPVGEPLNGSGRFERGQTTRSVMRFFAVMTVDSARSVGSKASAGAREAAEGAVRALGAMGGETRAFIRDAVIGVIEGSAQVMTVTAPAVKDIVAGGIRSSRRIKSDVTDAGRDVVAGAIVGAESVGFDDDEAVTAVVEGAVEGFEEAGGELGDAARSTIRGVVSGVAATGGDVATATRNATHLLVARAAMSEPYDAKMTGVAVGSIDAVLLEASRNPDLDSYVTIAAASGAVEAAYRINKNSGEAVREAVMNRVAHPSIDLPPRVRRRLPQIEAQLTSELSPTEGAWRGKAIFKAVPLLLDAGGVDLAGSLAYFTILSVFPLLALLMIGVAVFGNPDAVSVWIAEALIHYFPASSELIQQALGNFYSGSLALGIVAVVGILIGANGMFRAANRAVNRVFGLESKSIIRTTITEMAVATLFGVLFVLSILLTAFFHTALSIGQGFVDSPWGVTNLIVISLGVISTILPVMLAASIFAIVYHHMPNTPVEWRDATFGALVAIVFFEIGKHSFFWFTEVVSHRGIVYGPIASFVVLLTWSYIGGLIFLYGAAITRISGELRPRGIFRTHS